MDDRWKQAEGKKEAEPSETREDKGEGEVRNDCWRVINNNTKSSNAGN